MGKIPIVCRVLLLLNWVWSHIRFQNEKELCTDLISTLNRNRRLLINLNVIILFDVNTNDSLLNSVFCYIEDKNLFKITVMISIILKNNAPE